MSSVIDNGATVRELTLDQLDELTGLLTKSETIVCMIAESQDLTSMRRAAWAVQDMLARAHTIIS